MIIQKIIGPKKNICEEWEMFYHGGSSSEETDVLEVEKVKIEKGTKISLGTYFNAFSIGKWKKYTNLSDLTLNLYSKGQISIHGYHAIGSNYTYSDPRDNTKVVYDYKETSVEKIRVKVSHEELENQIRRYQVDFPELPEDGILYVEIEALEDVEFLGGEYSTTAKTVQEVYLGLGICTFRREEAVQLNVNCVIHEILEDEESPLKDNVEVYVSDNGQTLPEDCFKSDKVHLFKNLNLGGAGGFTRTMIEAVLYRQNSPITHMILMDDDISLDSRVITRTYLFLQHILPEYQKAMVGGELFELDKRYLQFEAGAAFRGTVIQSYNQKWDMRELSAVAANEIENPMNFNGWWYCCIPVSYIRPDNLPLPVFIHRDDVEYGLRNDEYGTILLNGIAVWHPQGPSKASASMNYYDVRNDLIAMSTSPDRATKKQIKGNITRGMFGNILRYRYQVEECVFYALEDYYLGPEHFMELDPAKNHQELSRFNYKMITPEEATGVDLTKIHHKETSDYPRGVFLLGAMCWLLPSKNSTRVCDYEDIGLPFRSRRLYIYDPEKNIGFETKKSYKELFKLLRHWHKVMKLIDKNHESVRQQWADKKAEYTSLAFWEEYLKLK